MNTKTRNEIAAWLFDRVGQGQNEEVGSMDWDTFNDGQEEFRVTIMKDVDNEYLVWMMEYAMADFSIKASSTERQIRRAIDSWYDTL